MVRAEDPSYILVSMWNHKIKRCPSM